MRVNRFGGNEGFQEFDLILTIESEGEARALYAIFNYFPNVDLLPFGISEKIREQIGDRYSKLMAGEEISNGVTYATFCSSKVKANK